jgi:hypothetical protein
MAVTLTSLGSRSGAGLWLSARADHSAQHAIVNVAFDVINQPDSGVVVWRVSLAYEAESATKTRRRIPTFHAFVPSWLLW